MAIEGLHPTNHIYSILLIVNFSLVSINCFVNPDELQIRCELVKAVFVSSNGIRVWWNISGLKQDPVDSSKCQLRLSNDLCDDPILQYEANIVYPNYLLNHTFWMDYETIKRTKSYKICIRLVTADALDQVNWSEKSLTVNERMPPVVGNCSVSIGIEIPKITFEKRDTYLYRRGDKVIFSCVIGGIPYPSVKWCKDAIECSGNSSTNPIAGGQIDSASSEDEGVYVAVVENSFGRAISEELYIREAVLEDFEADDGPTSLSHKAGDAFTVACRVPVSVPTPEVRWSKFSHGKWDTVEFSERAVLGLDGSLTILNADVKDSGNYSCKVTNRVVDHTLFSRNTTVKVLNETVFNIQPMIQNRISSNEDTRLGLVGHSVRMQCIYSGRPRPTISWFKDSVLITEEEEGIDFSSDGFTLTISSLKRDDEGNYRCQARNIINEYGFNMKLIVQETPGIVRRLEPKNATEGETVVFTCLGKGIPHPNIDWKINGNTVTEEMKDLLNLSISNDQSRLTIYSVNFNASCALQCNITNDHGHAVYSTTLNVFAPTRIQNLKSVDGRGHVMLTCEAQTDPLYPLFFNWTRGETTVVSDEVFTVFYNGSLLVNHTAASGQKRDSSGNYTCLAYSGLSADAGTIRVFVPPEKEEWSLDSAEIIRLSGLVLFGVLLAILVAILIATVLCKQRLRRIRKSTALGSPGGIVPQLSYSSHAETRSNDSHECLVCDFDFCNGLLPQNDQLKAAIRQMYIPKERIQLRDIVGKGQFGRVYSAYLRDPRDIVEEVAVKTMKYKPDESEMVELFLKEAVIMKDFQHIHVLGVRGITFDSDNSPMVILPFMANGDLRRYILQPNLDITILQLLLMGLQVAHGMQYLSQMRFVHRDLAARNCMVNDRGIVKVADFGLSRQLVRDYYRVESSGTTPVPVRWLAPECLEASLFTTMSDVWSFGVLLWELMTRGAVPYPDVENWQIPNHVQSGKRLEQPLYCPDVVYEIMQRCWEVEQQDRPSFQELVDSIQSVVQSAKPGARVSSSLYQNIVQRGGSVSDAGNTLPKTLDYRQ